MQPQHSASPQITPHTRAPHPTFCSALIPSFFFNSFHHVRMLSCRCPSDASFTNTWCLPHSLEKDRKVQNMVATTDLGFPIRLEGLVASKYGSFCNYEPELFPGLIYRLSKPKICVLVFVSGKVSASEPHAKANIFSGNDSNGFVFSSMLGAGVREEV